MFMNPILVYHDKRKSQAVHFREQRDENFEL